MHHRQHRYISREVTEEAMQRGCSDADRQSPTRESRAELADNVPIVRFKQALTLRDVTNDLVLRPSQPLFFNRAASR